MTTFGEQGRVNLRPGLGPRASQYAVERCGSGLSRRRHRRRGHRGLDVGSADAQGRRARRGPGVRRAHRKAAMAVQSDSPPWRSRQRDLGERLLVLQRRRQSLVAHQRRRGAGARLPADDLADQRHVRRAPARRQRLRQHARVRPVRDRRTASGTIRSSTTTSSITICRPHRSSRTSGSTGSRFERSSNSPSRRSRSSSTA